MPILDEKDYIQASVSWQVDGFWSVFWEDPKWGGVESEIPKNKLVPKIENGATMEIAKIRERGEIIGLNFGE